MLHTPSCENLEKSIAFADAFGFENVGKDFPDCCLPGDDYELELTYSMTMVPYVIGDGYAHVALVLLI